MASVQLGEAATMSNEFKYVPRQNLSQQYARTYQQCVEQATTLGRVVVLPKSNELQLDIDSEQDLVAFKARFDRLSKVLSEMSTKRPAIVRWNVTPSPSGRDGRYHVTISLPYDVHGEAHRILLQACLGSDPLREILNWRRYESGDAQPSLFFENAPEPSNVAEVSK
jgi:hypothetical protein